VIHHEAEYSIEAAWGRSNFSSARHKRREPMTEMNEFKKELSVRWIKAKSGNTYLCPVSALERIDEHSEEDLKKICVEESANVQND
jgi:hypothetical protein